jgi:putative transposase
MTNHVHLLITPERKDSAALLMKHLGQRYVQYINRSYKRSGTLWEGRFRSCLAQSAHYVLACYRYIELNPVRAGMVFGVRVKTRPTSCIPAAVRFIRATLVLQQ